MEKHPSNKGKRRNQSGRGGKVLNGTPDSQDAAKSASKEGSKSEKNASRAKINYLNGGLTIAFIFFSFWILAVKNGFMLRWYDEMSLFEPNRLFFNRLLDYPGGLLRYVGTFLTQFMYYPFLGSAIIISLWLLIAWLVKIDFGFKGKAFPLALLLPLTLLVSLVQLDEAWLTLKSEGYVFFPTLGYLFTLASYLAFSKSLKIPALSFVITVLIILCYAIAGFMLFWLPSYA